MKKLNTRGFTLIELLVVVAIIALLASIILASLNTARAKGRDARRIADTKDIQTALELFYSNNNHYPISTTQGIAATVLTGATGVGLTGDGDMSVVPDDPLGGTYHYEYISSAGGTTYCLGTALEGTAPTGSHTTCDTTPALTVTVPAGTLKYVVNP